MSVGAVSLWRVISPAVGSPDLVHNCQADRCFGLVGSGIILALLPPISRRGRSGKERRSIISFFCTFSLLRFSPSFFLISVTRDFFLFVHAVNF